MNIDNIKLKITNAYKETLDVSIWALFATLFVVDITGVYYNALGLYGAITTFSLFPILNQWILPVVALFLFLLFMWLVWSVSYFLCILLLRWIEN